MVGLGLRMFFLDKKKHHYCDEAEITELQIRKCSCPDDLFGIVPIALYKLFPKVEFCRVFLGRDGSLEDIAGEKFPYDAVTSGLVHCRELKQNILISAENPFHELLLKYVSAETLEKYGMSYMPIIHPDQQIVVCAIVFVGEHIVLDVEANAIIQLLSSGISDTYLAMQSLQYQSTFTLLSDLSSIEDNIAEGQLTVVKHLKAQTQAESGFLLTYSKADEDFVLKTMDDKILREQRFPCETLPFFQSNINLSKPILISYSSDSDVSSDITKVGGRISATQCLIAPVKQNTQTFGFVVLLRDEKSGRSFTPDDVRMAEDSLLITGSLLYKDLVVERERHLREQTEKLHQVARNIFTHLGNHFGQLLKEHYQRLINLVIIPDIPTVFQATHHFPNYRNVYIPPLGCQRLISLDDRLLVIGPRSFRHATSQDPLKVRLAREEGSDDTGVSSVLNMYEIANGVESVSSCGNFEVDLSSQQLNQAMRDKRESTAPNLHGISEEVEAYFQDSRSLFESTRYGKSADVEPSRLPVLQEDEGATLEADTNNNADSEDKSKKSRRSNQSLHTSKSIARTSFQNRHQSLPCAQNDVVSQILGAAADVPLSFRQSRRSTVLGSHQRPSILGMTSIAAGQRMSSHFQADRFSGGQASSKAGTKFSLIHMPVVEAVSSSINTKGSAALPKSNPNYLKELNENKSDVENKVENGEQNAFETRSKTHSNSALSVKDSKWKKEKSTVSNVADPGMTPSGSDFSDSNRPSTVGSRNDSEESDDLRNFQAALKMDFHIPGQTMVDREKTLLHSILEYRRRSVLDESASLYVDRALRGYDAKNQAQDKESKNSLIRTKSNFVINKDVSEKKQSTQSYEGFGMHQGKAITQKMGSQSSMIDVSSWSTKRKVTIEGPNQQMKSVMNLDARARDARDSRFAIADKLERVGESRHQQLPTSMRENDFIAMTLSVTDGASGPFHQRTSAVDFPLRARMSVSEPIQDKRSGPEDKIDERLRAQRMASNPAVGGGRLAKVQVTKTIPSRDILPLSNRRTSYDRSSQMNVRTDSNNMEKTTSSFRLARGSSSSTDQPVSSLKRKTGFQNRQLNTLDLPPDVLSPLSGTVLQPVAEQTAFIQTGKRKHSFNSSHENLAITFLPHRLRKLSVDESSEAHVQFDDKISRNVRSNTESQRGSFNIGDVDFLKKRSRQLTMSEPPHDSLVPLISPLSGTVIPSLIRTTSARSMAKARLSEKDSIEPTASIDSDIETLLYSDIPSYLAVNDGSGNSSSLGSQKSKKKVKLLEVLAVNPKTNDYELFGWREMTLKICKFMPATHCFGIDENDLTILLKEIMQEARYLCHAERCSVFLLDEERSELIAKVFDGNIASDEEVRISVGSGIAGKVVETGKILNIKDAYSCPLFYRGIDESTGFRTRNILCFPIKDEKDVIIGAAQLCNKIGGPHFDSTDEVIAKALATYCCISILNAGRSNQMSLMYRDVLDAHNRVKLANELMVFHMLVATEDVEELTKQPVIPITEFGEDLHLQEFKLSVPRNVQINSMPQAVISMVHELQFDRHFKIKPNTLARFVLMVKKGYRDPPYHNWNHAFSVAHFAYLLLRNLKCVADGVFDELEALAFFVASLCHDIDHRGTSNSFQVASNSVLAALYSSEGSVMERHHFSQTLCILNTGGCNIFENVSRKEYEQLLDLIRDVILSTDIAHHLRIRGGLEAMAQAGYDKGNDEHKSLLMCLFMTSADLSDQTKPWSAAKPVSKMLYKEFFSQGDLEKALGRNPMEMMDRERASIPDLQIGFIDHIVLPAFRSLRIIFPQTGCLVDNIEDNREHWITIKSKTEDRRDSLTSLEIYDFIDDEDERSASDANGESPGGESPTGESPTGESPTGLFPAGGSPSAESP